jgi:hypothetical protein
MNWKFDFSPETSDIFAVGGGAVDLSVGRWWYPVGLDVANFAKPVAEHFGKPWRRVCGCGRKAHGPHFWGDQDMY